MKALRTIERDYLTPGGLSSAIAFREGAGLGRPCLAGSRRLGALESAQTTQDREGQLASGIDETLVGELHRRLTGRVLRPSEVDYDEARTVFNAMIDRRPAVIAQCADTADVASAIGWAREAGLEIAVRGGGHSVAGKALVDDGIVIDLRDIHGVTVDPDARTATVGGGATMSHLDRATEPYGLATTGGRVSTTGVGGFTLGGGGGWLDRKFGLACDNLLSAEIVTADGEILRVDDNNPTCSGRCMAAAAISASSHR